jgi:hypothetical protein
VKSPHRRPEWHLVEDAEALGDGMSEIAHERHDERLLVVAHGGETTRIARCAQPREVRELGIH